MIKLSNEQLAALRITRFIFHVVHHGEPEPVFLDEIEIGEFEPFFLDRVKSILKGTAFEFNPQAGVYTILESIRNEPSMFLELSRQLAVNFHAHGLEDKRIKKGVMILMGLSTLQKDMFAIIKYEHEEVLRYSKEGSRVVLESVADTFTGSPDAMQKAALVDISEENPVVMVIDRNVRAGISGFFQGFLNVRRKKSEKEMTESLWDVVKNTSRKHIEELPREFSQQLQQRTDQFLKSQDSFNETEFFDQVFGPYANDSIRNTYRSCLKKGELENEQFYLDKDAAASVSKKRKIKTAEGITIYVDERAASTIQLSYGQNGEKDVIIIETERIREEI
ncbi:MAG TPA: nucleoid-associated protein [Chitinispirillaceae bacterium]|nr:nucleoid-associated protein [Chitinispirillaceae bacterium]